ncbi:MAG: ATP-binding cassette domain-containing protein, partial [Bacteroidetes bacterium]
LQTKDLQYRYASGPELRFPDIACQTGEHWLILGQSGCGKTTLLHLLGGLLTPQKGHIFIEKTDLTTLGAGKLDHFRGQHIGFVFQKPHFVHALTVGENLRLAQQLAGNKPDQNRIGELLRRLRLDHKTHAKPAALSQGEQQRAAIARALVNRPTLILADEPTSALDDLNTEQVIRLLEEQANEVQATLLVVTHDGRLKSQFDRQIHL